MNASLTVFSAKGEPLYVKHGEAVERLLGEGKTLRAIAAELGISTNTVARAAHRRDVSTSAGRTEAVRAWMQQARLSQAKTLAESYELSTVARLMLLDELGSGDPDWVAVKTLNAVGGTWADKGIELGRLLKDAQAEEHRQQTADKLMEMTEAIRAAASGVPLP